MVIVMMMAWRWWMMVCGDWYGRYVGVWTTGTTTTLAHYSASQNQDVYNEFYRRASADPVGVMMCFVGGNVMLRWH